MTKTPKPLPPQRQKLLDWPAIKADYIEGISLNGVRRYPTYEDLSERYDAHPTTLRARGGEENWRDERATFQQHLEQDRRAQRTHELATLAADLDVNALRIARAGMSITASRISELGQQAQLRAQGLQAGVDRGTLPPPPDSDELRSLSLTAKEWYELGVKALGMETPQHLIISGDPDAPVKLDVTTRDQRTLSILSIFTEAGVFPHDLDAAGPVLDVAGTESLPPSEADTPTGEQVHPEDADDGSEREPEAGSLPAA